MKFTIPEWSLVTFTVVHERAYHLLHERRHGKRHTELFPGEERVVQILLVQPNAEPRREIALDHHRSLGVQHVASREPTSNRLEDDARIESSLSGEHQGFANRLDVRGHDDLIRELRRIPRAIATAEHVAFSDNAKNGLRTRENVRLAPDHDGELPRDRSGLTAAHGRIEKVDSLFFASLRDLLGHSRCDRAHVDDNGSPSSALEHALLAQDDLLGVERVGKHRDDSIDPFGAASGGVRCRSSIGDELVDGWPEAIATVTAKPALRRFFAIGLPMIPSPTNPTFLIATTLHSPFG